MQQIPNSDEQAVLRTLTKRRNIYTVLFVITLIIGGVCGIIPKFGWYISIAMLVIWGIFAGLAMLCINYYRSLKTEGRKQGGGLWWGLLFVFGLFLIPLLTVVICNHCTPLLNKVLGVQLR